MLRIFTFLRNAFERPPEREGRGLRFAKKPGDEREEMAMGEESGEKPATDQEEGGTLPPIRERTHEEVQDTIGSGEEPREEAPESGNGGEHGTEGELHAGEEAREREEKMRLRAEQLVEKANQALEKIKKIRAILMDEDFMEKIREAARRDTRVRDLLTSLEGDRDTCATVENDVLDLKRAAEQCVLWQDPTEQTSQPQQFLEAMATARAKRTDLDPEEEERKAATLAGYRGRTDVSDIEERWDTKSIEEKVPFIEEFKNLADFDNMLGKMDDMLTSYNAALDEYLALIEKLRADLEKGNVPEPPQMEWGGNFTLKLIHFVYLAMAIKKIYDTWKKQWEYDFERAVGDCAAAISPWVAPNTVTQRLHQEQDENMRKIKDAYKKVYERSTFVELHGALLAPHPDPAVKQAQLEIAAERGWLYESTPGATPEQTLFFGKQLGTLMPSSWSTGQKESYIQDILITNSQAGKKREEAGVAIADKYKKGAWRMLPELQKALERHDYHFARGIMKRALLKGDLGHTPTWATMKLINMLRKNQCPYITGDLIKTFGDMVAQPDFGAPQSYLLLTTKFLMEEYKKLIGKGAAPEEIFLGGNAEPIAAVIVKAERLITTHGGPLLDEDEQTYTGPSKEEKLEYAVGKFLAGTVVHTVDGTDISLYDETVPEFVAYRTMVKESPEKYSVEISLTKMDPDYTNAMGELFLLDKTVLSPLFAAGTHGALPRGKQVDGIFAQIDAEAKRLEGSPQTYGSFIRAMQERFEENFLAFLQHKSAHVGIAELTHTKKFIERLRLREKIEDLIRNGKIEELAVPVLRRILNE